MYTKILVPLDLNEGSFADKAVVAARDLAQQFNAELFLLTVVPGFEMPLVATYFPEQAHQAMMTDAREAVEAEAETVLKGSGVTYHCLVKEGKPVEAIQTEARRLGVDLVVMASHKRRRLERVALGAVTNKVVAQSDVPVLVIKP
ncbi:universal stress protein [Saccharospirillum salsuginis]|nr:universal stress protein [Saccharospirillum salsuginis]